MRIWINIALFYVLGVAISFLFITCAVSLSSKLSKKEDTDIEEIVYRKTGVIIGNSNQFLNSVSIWIYLYFCIVWPFALLKFLFKLFFTKKI